MHLEPDIATHRDRHQGDLEIPPAPGDRAVIRVLSRRLLEIKRLRFRSDILDGHSTRLRLEDSFYVQGPLDPAMEIGPVRVRKVLANARSSRL
jgi:hypothetical protein